MNVLISPQVVPTAWTFTQGFLVGQACFIILCLLFVRYVVFSPAEADDGEAWRQRRAERAKVGNKASGHH
jgi:maintenance of morphology protein 1